jgi:hypothetical protein
MTHTTREAGAAFADVVYADQQWVDAEFDALISASFSQPPAPPRPAPPRPAPPRPAPPRVPPRPGFPCQPLSRRPEPRLAAVMAPAPGPGHGRQRSPPAYLPSRPPGRP